MVCVAMTGCSVLGLMMMMVRVMVMVMVMVMMRPRASVVSMLDTGMGGWLCGGGRARIFINAAVCVVCV